MPKKDIIVIGTSAGGIDALRQIVSRLPADLGAAIFVVLHTAPQSPGLLDEILNRAGPLPAVKAVDHDAIRSGRIYVAMPDYHLLLEPGIVRLTRGPKENRFRPAIDPLFRSAAQTYGPRVIGAVLTGGLDDGTAGLWAVKQLGGTAIVQDPEEAFAPSMPLNALKYVKVDYCLPLAEIAPLLAQLTSEPMEEEGERHMPEEIDIEVKIAKENSSLSAGVLKLGEPSNYTCPECHGVLLQLKEAGRTRFRCHTGHAYSTDSLMTEITGKIEDSLWNAIRAIEENVLLLRHLADHSRASADQDMAAAYFKQAQEAERRADQVRQVTMGYDELTAIKQADLVRD
jgi:two-component system chemotaxis response regulator CheB